jgi:VIT1/CCC1 family predicted Fe2+/Mn2+ transporter
MDQQYPQYPQYPQHLQPVPYAPAPPTNSFAVTSLILSLVGLGLFGVIFGHIGLGQIKRTGERGDGMAIAGLIVGYIEIAFWAVIILVLLAAAGGSGG